MFFGSYGTGIIDFVASDGDANAAWLCLLGTMSDDNAEVGGGATFGHFAWMCPCAGVRSYNVVGFIALKETSEFVAHTVFPCMADRAAFEFWAFS